MFQFTTTTIVNSNKAVDVKNTPLLDANGDEVSKFIAKDDIFRVHGTGTFRKDAIQSVYKREASIGKLGKVTLTVPTVQVEDSNLLRLHINIKLTGKTQSDYTNYYGDFSKPVVIDIVPTGTVTGDAEEFERLINRLRHDYGSAFVKVERSGATLALTAREEGQIVSAELFEVDSANTLQPKIKSIAKSKETVKGSAGFGNTDWMLRSVTLPTYDNTRHFGVNRDERPVAGALYDQFTLRYIVRSGEDGIWNGNKQSVTTHVFWVNQDVSDEFKTELEKVFADIETVTDDPKANKESNPGGAVGSDDPVDPGTEG